MTDFLKNVGKSNELQNHLWSGLSRPTNSQAYDQQDEGENLQANIDSYSSLKGVQPIAKLENSQTLAHETSNGIPFLSQHSNSSVAFSLML